MSYISANYNISFLGEIDNMERKNMIAGLLKRIDEFDVNNFDDRLRVQKIIFLMQTILGHKFKFPYTLYVHGPYSPKLSDLFYGFKDTLQFKTVKFKDGTNEDNFKEFIAIIQDFSNDRLMLELVSTLAYINKNLNIHDEKEMLTKLKSIKPSYKENIYTQALNYYKELAKFKNK